MGRHPRVFKQLRFYTNTLDVQHLSITISLELVADRVALLDSLRKSTQQANTYGRAPSIECKKARTNESPAFLAPNSNGILLIINQILNIFMSSGLLIQLNSVPCTSKSEINFQIYQKGLNSCNLPFETENFTIISLYINIISHLKVLMTSSFSVKKTQEIYYFVNRQKHKKQLREIKPATNTGIKRQSLDTFSREKSSLSYAQKYQIDLGNSRLVNRILNIAKSNKLSMFKPQYNRLPVQKRNIIKNQQLQRQNSAFLQRIKRAKPAIGSRVEWKKEFQRNSLLRRKTKQSQKDSGVEEILKKDSYIKRKIERQASLTRKMKGNSDYIFSLPQVQSKHRYKTEAEGSSNPGTMR